MGFSSLLKQGVHFARRHASEIYTVGAGVGTIATVILTKKASFKAVKVLEEKYHEYIDEVQEEVAVTQRAKDTWKCYIWPGIAGTLTLAAIYGGHKVNTARIAVISAAAAMSEQALKEFTAKTVERIGERKTQAITDSIVQDKVINDPVSNKEIYITNKGETLFYDTLSGRYFKHDIETVKKTINELNKELLDDMYVSLNDLYYSIGLKGTELGGQLGWNVNRDGLIDISFVAQKADNDEPCLALSYTVNPMYNYDTLY